MNKNLFNTKKQLEIVNESSCCDARGGCKNPAAEPHTCPFSEEINGDSESLCNCCDDCMYECAMDI